MSHNKTILQVNVAANWGSHGRIAEGIGALAIEKDWESYIAYGRYANNSQSSLIKIGNKRDVYQHVAESRLFDNHGLASRGVTENFIKKVEDLNPDIIHLHNIHGYYLNYKKFFDFLKTANIPVVWTLHDCWPITGHCSFPISADCKKWTEHCKSPCPLRRDYPSSWLFGRSFENYNIKKVVFNSLESLHIVTVSKWLEEEVRKSFLRDLDIRCIYNGIDTTIFKLVENESLFIKHNIKNNERVVLGVASVWEKRKGLYDFYQLRQLLPSNYRIILIGLSAKQINNLPSGIDVVSRTDSQQELAAYYSMADVYVNPSQAETFGMTTAEAMACGTPAIVYDVTACPELIDEYTGRVVALGDVEALAKTIIEICENPLLPESCRERAVKLFNKDERYMDYLKLYNELISEK